MIGCFNNDLWLQLCSYRKVSVRQKEREPQILTITHDEDDNNNEETLMDYEDDLGIHSVTPPANSPDAEFGRIPSPPGRLGSPKGPMQSHKGPVRPKTAGKLNGWKCSLHFLKQIGEVSVR